MRDEKRCPGCGFTLPLTEFHKDRGTTDGRQGVCKACRRQYWSDTGAERQRARRAANIARHLAAEGLDAAGENRGK